MVININIPNAKIPKLLEALNYTPELGAQDAFIKAVIKGVLQNSVVAYETHKAMRDLVSTDLNVT